MTYQTTIKKLREEHNWTQEEFAERIGMSKNGYAKIERGESSPNIERLEKIAHALGGSGRFIQITGCLRG